MIKARYSMTDAAQALYLALHNITITSEAGKHLTTEQLTQAQKALADADRLSQLRELAYPAGSDLV